MGVVYKARQVKLNRFVALKMLHGARSPAVAEQSRFRTEVEAIARLQHPNIVQVFEVGDHEGGPFFSMEWCSGGSLEKKLRQALLPPHEAARVVAMLARAMHAAHEKKVLHRDLKPANVLLAEDGTPKVSDFGLAKKLDEAGHTVTGAVMGTPCYMPPEQARGETKALGPGVDVYALGAVLYECLTGKPPFKAATVADTLMAVVLNDPVPPRQMQPLVPRDLETICLKCLQKEPQKRYCSALELADDLGRFQAGETVHARPVGTVERLTRWRRRNPVVANLIAAVAFLVLAVAVGSSVAAGYFRQLATQEQLAKEDAQQATKREEEAKEEAQQATKREEAKAGENLALATEKSRLAGKLSGALAQEQARAKESLERLERQYVLEGIRAQQQNDLLGALPWFAEALQLRANDPIAQQPHRLRLAALLQQAPALTHCWFHDLPVNYAEFSPDGSRVVTASEDGTARVWDAVTGAEVTFPLKHQEKTGHRTLTPSDFHYVMADNQVRAGARGPEVPPSPARNPPTGRIYHAAFSPDGRRITPARNKIKVQSRRRIGHEDLENN